jgi:quercetin dioxygenase-like cupin family protein
VQFLDVARLYEVPSVLVGVSQNALQFTYVTFVASNQSPVVERKPGWRGRYFDSPSMTFAHYEFDAGSSIHEHFHPEEEVWQIVEGELEITIDGVTKRVGPGSVGIVPSNTRHSVKAIIVDYPLREHPDQLLPLHTAGLADKRV